MSSSATKVTHFVTQVSMKKILIFAALLVLSPILSDAAEVRGHFLKDGTSVVPNPIVAPKDGRNTKVTEQPIEPDSIPDNTVPVGPSGQEIHNFLYPKLNDGKVVIPGPGSKRHNHEPRFDIFSFVPSLALPSTTS
jgi:hypothetical protein